MYIFSVSHGIHVVLEYRFVNICSVRQIYMLDLLTFFGMTFALQMRLAVSQRDNKEITKILCNFELKITKRN